MAMGEILDSSKFISLIKIKKTKKQQHYRLFTGENMFLLFSQLTTAQTYFTN